MKSSKIEYSQKNAEIELRSLLFGDCKSKCYFVIAKTKLTKRNYNTN